jgi:hypothetical protein
MSSRVGFGIVATFAFVALAACEPTSASLGPTATPSPLPTASPTTNPTASPTPNVNAGPFAEALSWTGSGRGVLTRAYARATSPLST